MQASKRLLVVSLCLGLSACDPATNDGDTGGGDSGAGDTDSDGGLGDVGGDVGGDDAGADAGSPSTADIRFLLPGRPIDLTPDGTRAVVEDPNVGEVFFYDVVTGTLTLEATLADSAYNFSTGVASDGRLAAVNGVPVQAAVWDIGAWLDLDSPFSEGCGQEIASAWDISADGAVVIGMAWDTCSPAAVRWSRDVDGLYSSTLLERLGSSPGASGPSNRATVISDDGRIAAGFAQTDMVDRWPAVWAEDGTGILLPGTPADAPGEVLAISAQGDVVAGTQNLEGFTWSEADGYVVIGRLPTAFGADTAYPNAIARDGELVFGGCGGFGATEAFVWTASEGMRALAPILEANDITLPPGYTLQNILAASADGTVLLGSSATASGTPGSFVLRLPVSAYGL